MVSNFTPFSIYFFVLINMSYVRLNIGQLLFLLPNSELRQRVRTWSDYINIVLLLKLALFLINIYVNTLILICYSSGLEARILQIDFSAAYDRVNHQGNLYRLCSVGIGGSVLSILTEFLSNRLSQKNFLRDAQNNSSSALPEPADAVK